MKEEQPTRSEEDECVLWLKETRDWDRHGRGYIRKSDNLLEPLYETMIAFHRHCTESELKQLRQELRWRKTGCTCGADRTGPSAEAHSKTCILERAEAAEAELEQVRQERDACRNYVSALEKEAGGPELLATAAKRAEAAEQSRERMREALEKMLSPEMDWEDGEIGVGGKFRALARKALEGER